jgi:hypothetical protein
MTIVFLACIKDWGAFLERNLRLLIVFVVSLDMVLCPVRSAMKNLDSTAGTRRIRGNRVKASLKSWCEYSFLETILE